MTEHAPKAELLQRMQTGYEQLTALLTTLSEEQLTTPGVNGKWSIKDNIAHLTTWQKYLIGVLTAIHNKETTFPNPTPGMSEDEENELYYQANKDRSLSDVQNEFAAVYQQTRDAVELLSEEELNMPLEQWKGQPVWPNIVGNTFGHYEEHSQIIQKWLASQHS
ncbi:ClbS/DfsB family four-helix bundle protein [Dictyobacter formicarum]|uniref:ClbS/DfsB family four-helix bundle protein n=1 Tax=Dictyobacter formicarum TaxID=2778368 RepID=A0ABQ3VNL9_9CHLR|nr:ClbS/DfsB family four-helix bundle protein [Dictyobacter formicarum]GHO87837.1 hypothetical protein KSZ_58430 [Dictyobacter formicarum]